MVSRKKSQRKSKKVRSRKARRQGLRAKEVQLLIAVEDWDALRSAVENEDVSYATLRSVVSEYRDLAGSGNERAKAILEKLQEAGVRAGFRNRGSRASRIAFGKPVARRVQVVENKKTGNRTYLVSGISLKPYVEPEPGVKALPEDLVVHVTYHKAGLIEINW